MANDANSKPSNDQIKLYAAISGIALIFAILVGYYLISNLDRLRPGDNIEKGYYFVLVVLAASLSAFLFGTLKSMAALTGKHPSGELQLGGPAALAALVVLGGFILPPKPPADFTLTIQLVGVEPDETQFVGSASGLIQYENFTGSLNFDRLGQATVSLVPSRVINSYITIFFKSNLYRLLEGQESIKVPPEKVIRLKVQKISEKEIDAKHFTAIVNNVVSTVSLAGALSNSSIPRHLQEPAAMGAKEAVFAEQVAKNGSLRIDSGTLNMQSDLLIYAHTFELKNSILVTNGYRLTVVALKFTSTASRIVSFGESSRIAPGVGAIGQPAGEVRLAALTNPVGSLLVSLRGQDGAKGKTGASGPVGGAGDRGSNGADGGIPPHCLRGGGDGDRGKDGQPGLRGEKGGDGGRGGNLLLAGTLASELQSSSFLTIDLAGGSAGAGGDGGPGGPGGPGGSGGSGTVFCRGGHGGPSGGQGPSGPAGEPGAPGTNGTASRFNL